MFFIIFFYYVIQYFFERCCSFFFLSEKEIQQLLESVIRPLIQNETCIPKKRTDYKKYCIDLYFHGYSVGCCTDMNDVLLKREKQLIKHIGTCFVAPSTVTSFKSDDLLNRLFFLFLLCLNALNSSVILAVCSIYQETKKMTMTSLVSLKEYLKFQLKHSRDGDSLFCSRISELCWNICS